MKKNIIITVFVIIALVLAAVLLMVRNTLQKNQLPPVENGAVKVEMPQSQDTAAKPASPEQNNFPFDPPLDRAGERVTKKPFGIFITPQNSPVQPERFRGYHTGADFEIFPEELNTDVAVRSICDGSIVVKRRASGYGGVLVQKCELDKSPIAVIYGHLNLANIQKNVGESLSKGEAIGFLGKDKSAQTDGERKHLHLGMHKGSQADILGYVATKEELSGWLNPCDYVCR